LSVRAGLLETTPIPSVDAIEPYLRALVVYRYEIKKVLSGSLDAEEILVAHWAVLDRQAAAETSQKRTGNIYELHLENFEDHPQLGSELRLNTIENIFLPMYYEVSKIVGRAQAIKIFSPDREKR